MDVASKHALSGTELMVKLYADYLLPLLVRVKRTALNNKARVITAAVALTLLYRVAHKIWRPPKALRQVPYIGFFEYLLARIDRNATAEDLARRFTLPAALQTEEGLYVSFNPRSWTLHIADPRWAKLYLFRRDIFQKPELKLGSMVSQTVNGKFFSGPNILLTEGHEWRKHRKIVNPAFHRAMPVDLFNRLTHHLFGVMEVEMDQDGIIDFHDIMTRFTLEAIGKAGFGFDFNAIQDKNSKWVRTYDRIGAAMREIKFLVLPFLDCYFLPFFPERRKSHEELDRFMHLLDEVIENKRSSLQRQRDLRVKESERDLLTLMIESELDGEGALTNEELKSDLCIFFLAGHDTTANALSFAIYYLAKHPNIQEKARQEAIKVFGDEPTDITVTAEETKDMQYLNCILKEVMRIAPPATNTTVRRLTEDTEIGSHVFPKGTDVILDIYELHHNPRVWKNPSEFRPERFLPGGEGEKSGTNMAWLPFSNGARQCIGMNFSLAEQRVLLPSLLRKYEWHLPADSPHKDKPVTNSGGILTIKDFEVAFRKRY